MTTNNPTVLFTAVSDSNPYHKLLFEALEAKNVIPVKGSESLFLPLTRSILHNSSIDVVHLGWLYPFYHVNHYTTSTILDTIITVGRAFWFCIDLLFVRFVFRRQLVWTVHNKYHHEQRYLRTEKVLNILVSKIVHVLTVKCVSAKKEIKQLYRIQDQSKIITVSDGNYISAYPNDVTQTGARDELEIQKETFVYLFFGLIRPYKGIYELLEQFSKIEDENCELWVVGNPKNEQIEQKVILLAAQDDRIQTVLEFVPNEKVQYYMNAADVLVLPYRDILNAGSVHLGMSFAMPIVVSSLGCIPETVPNDYELLYDPDQPHALKNSLREVREMNLDPIMERNLRCAKSQSWETAAEKYKSIYAGS